MPVSYHRNVSTAPRGDRLGARRTRGALGVQAWGPAETTLSKCPNQNRIGCTRANSTPRESVSGSGRRRSILWVATNSGLWRC
jgi:hypothetical protein